MTKTTRACRAEDPKKCPHHGAVLRMEQATDFNSYYRARNEIESLKNKGWEEEIVMEDLAPFHHPGAVSSDDPRVQAGEVIDEIEVQEGGGYSTLFSRVRPKVHAGTPYAIRLQANRPLTPEEVQQAAGALGYRYRSTIAGESLGSPEIDSPYSFVVAADMTKSSRDDLGIALEDFEHDLDGAIINGSPVRKTDRAGAGTKGTRLVDGLQDSTLHFELYYDDVFRLDK